MRKIERFDKYMKFKGLNDNKVTIQLGISVGTLGKSRKDNRDLSDKVIEQILKFYTDLDRIWLLTGEGEMLTSSPPGDAGMGDLGINDMNAEQVWYTYKLPVSAEGGTLNNFTVSVRKEDCERVVSPIKDIDFVITISGESMEPEYSNGSQVFVKRINEKAFIEWGRVYVLDTVNGPVIKMLMPGDTKDTVTCVSINSKFPPFQVAMSDVRGVYRVLMCMSIK